MGGCSKPSWGAVNDGRVPDPPPQGGNFKNKLTTKQLFEQEYNCSDNCLSSKTIIVLKKKSRKYKDLNARLYSKISALGPGRPLGGPSRQYGVGLDLTPPTPYLYTSLDPEYLTAALCQGRVFIVLCLSQLTLLLVTSHYTTTNQWIFIYQLILHREFLISRQSPTFKDKYCNMVHMVVEYKQALSSVCW